MIPLVSTWHPVAVVSVCLPFAVELTAHARSQFSRLGWRDVHPASFVLVSTATMFGLRTGTDTKSATGRMVALAVSTVFVGLTVVRVGERARSRTAVCRPACTGRATLLNR